jgi:hypothetical protein
MSAVDLPIVGGKPVERESAIPSVSETVSAMLVRIKKGAVQVYLGRINELGGL